MATLAQPAVAAPVAAERKVAAGLWSNAWYRLRHDKLTMGAFAVLGTLILLSLAAPLIADQVFHFRFEEQQLGKAYSQPTLNPPAYVLGADELGRSQIVRLLYGGQGSPFVGVVGAPVNLTIRVAGGVTPG